MDSTDGSTTTKSAYHSAVYQIAYRCEVLGTSTLGQGLSVWLPISKTPSVLVIGGVHGDETESIDFSHDILRKLMNSDCAEQGVAVLPCLNPDGFILSQRTNARGVDLNRNLPTSNWSPEALDPRYPPGSAPASEIETKVFMNLLAQLNWPFVISIHSFTKSLLLCPSNLDERRLNYIEGMSERLKIPLVNKMPYPVAGSLNTLAHEKKLGCITLELPRDNLFRDRREDYLTEVLGLLKFLQER